MKYIYFIVEKLVETGLIIGITAIVLNIAFLCAVSRLRKRERPHYRFFKSLAISDLLGSLSYLLTVNFPHGFLGVIAASDFAFLRALPYVIRSIPWMLFTAYLLTLTCLTINQYLSVCKPWSYTRLARYRRVTISLISVWSISSLHIIIPLGIIVALSVISWGHTDPMPVLHKSASGEKRQAKRSLRECLLTTGGGLQNPWEGGSQNTRCLLWLDHKF